MMLESGRNPSRSGPGTGAPTDTRIEEHGTGEGPGDGGGDGRAGHTEPGAGDGQREVAKLHSAGLIDEQEVENEVEQIGGEIKL